MSLPPENSKTNGPYFSRITSSWGACLFLLASILVLSFCLRVFRIDGNSLWTDEFTTWLLSSQTSFAEVFSLSFQIPQPVPPLFFLANKFFYGFLPQNEIGLRFLSVLSGFLTTWYVFRIGRDLFAPATGLLGALLFAINSFQLYQAHNARPYALGLLFGAVSMSYFIQLLKKPPTVFPATVYILSTLFMVQTHYFFVVQWWIQMVFLVWRMAMDPPQRTRWKGWVVSQGILLMAMIGLLGQFLQIQQRRQSYNWAGSLFPPLERLFVFLEPQVLLWAALATVMVWMVTAFFQRDGEPGGPPSRIHLSCVPTPHLQLLFLWYFLPVVLFYLFSWITGTNIFVDRYLITSSIPALLLIPAVAQKLFSFRWSLLFLAFYAGSYLGMIPCRYYRENGQFHSGPPGGNQWRESLPLLSDPRLQAPLRLVFSPFFESSQLEFLSQPGLSAYFSSPYRSFYCQIPAGEYLVMPFIWEVSDPKHRKRQNEILAKVEEAREFVIFCPRSYWEQFGEVLSRTFSPRYQIKETVRFESSGVLQIRKIQLIPFEMGK